MSLATWEEVEEIQRKKRETAAAELAAMAEGAAVTEACPVPPEPVVEQVIEPVSEPEPEVKTEPKPPARRTRHGV